MEFETGLSLLREEIIMITSNELKEWAQKLSDLDEHGSGLDMSRSLIDFLTTLANVSADEPESHPIEMWMGSKLGFKWLVIKEYADWHKAQHMRLAVELAAANARIAELQEHINLVDPIVRRDADQPPRPPLNQEQWDALCNFIGTAFEIIAKSATPDELIKAKEVARKLLVGDVT